MREVLRHRVVRWLVRRQKLSSDLAACLLGWKHSGFSLDASRRVPAGRRPRLERLLAYMARHPFDPAGIRYDVATDTVRYRARRRHAVRKIAIIKVDALDFIAMLAFELRKTHVTVSCLCPGGTRTEFMEVAGNELKRFADKTLMIPEKCASIGLKAMFRGRPKVVSGTISKFSRCATRLTPRKLNARAACWVIGEPAKKE